MSESRLQRLLTVAEQLADNNPQSAAVVEHERTEAGKDLAILFYRHQGDTKDFYNAALTDLRKAFQMYEKTLNKDIKRLQKNAGNLNDEQIVEQLMPIVYTKRRMEFLRDVATLDGVSKLLPSTHEDPSNQGKQTRVEVLLGTNYNLPSEVSRPQQAQRQQQQQQPSAAQLEDERSALLDKFEEERAALEDLSNQLSAIQQKIEFTQQQIVDDKKGEFRESLLQRVQYLLGEQTRLEAAFAKRKVKLDGVGNAISQFDARFGGGAPAASSSSFDAKTALAVGAAAAVASYAEQVAQEAARQNKRQAERERQQVANATTVGNAEDAKEAIEYAALVAKNAAETQRAAQLARENAMLMEQKQKIKEEHDAAMARLEQASKVKAQLEREIDARRREATKNPSAADVMNQFLTPLMAEERDAYIQVEQNSARVAAAIKELNRIEKQTVETHKQLKEAQKDAEDTTKTMQIMAGDNAKKIFAHLKPAYGDSFFQHGLTGVLNWRTVKWFRTLFYNLATKELPKGLQAILLGVLVSSIRVAPDVLAWLWNSTLARLLGDRFKVGGVHKAAKTVANWIADATFGEIDDEEDEEESGKPGVSKPQVGYQVRGNTSRTGGGGIPVWLGGGGLGTKQKRSAAENFDLWKTHTLGLGQDTNERQQQRGLPLSWGATTAPTRQQNKKGGGLWGALAAAAADSDDDEEESDDEPPRKRKGKGGASGQFKGLVVHSKTIPRNETMGQAAGQYFNSWDQIVMKWTTDQLVIGAVFSVNQPDVLYLGYIGVNGPEPLYDEAAAHMDFVFKGKDGDGYRQLWWKWKEQDNSHYRQAYMLPMRSTEDVMNSFQGNVWPVRLTNVREFVDNLNDLIQIPAYISLQDLMDATKAAHLNQSRSMGTSSGKMQRMDKLRILGRANGDTPAGPSSYVLNWLGMGPGMEALMNLQRMRRRARDNVDPYAQRPAPTESYDGPSMLRGGTRRVNPGVVTDPNDDGPNDDGIDNSPDAVFSGAERRRNLRAADMGPDDGGMTRDERRWYINQLRQEANAAPAAAADAETAAARARSWQEAQQTADTLVNNFVSRNQDRIDEWNQYYAEQAAQEAAAAQRLDAERQARTALVAESQARLQQPIARTQIEAPRISEPARPMPPMEPFRQVELDRSDPFWTNVPAPRLDIPEGRRRELYERRVQQHNEYMDNLEKQREQRLQVQRARDQADQEAWVRQRGAQQAEEAKREELRGQTRQRDRMRRQQEEEEWQQRKTAFDQRRTQRQLDREPDMPQNYYDPAADLADPNSQASKFADMMKRYNAAQEKTAVPYEYADPAGYSGNVYPQPQWSKPWTTGTGAYAIGGSTFTDVPRTSGPRGARPSAQPATGEEDDDNTLGDDPRSEGLDWDTPAQYVGPQAAVPEPMDIGYVAPSNLTTINFKEPSRSFHWDKQLLRVTNPAPMRFVQGQLIQRTIPRRVTKMFGLPRAAVDPLTDNAALANFTRSLETTALGLGALPEAALWWSGQNLAQSTVYEAAKKPIDKAWNWFANTDTGEALGSALSGTGEGLGTAEKWLEDIPVVGKAVEGVADAVDVVGHGLFDAASKVQGGFNVAGKGIVEGSEDVADAIGEFYGLIPHKPSPYVLRFLRGLNQQQKDALLAQHPRLKFYVEAGPDYLGDAEREWMKIQAKMSKEAAVAKQVADLRKSGYVVLQDATGKPIWWGTQSQLDKERAANRAAKDKFQDQLNADSAATAASNAAAEANAARIAAGIADETQNNQIAMQQTIARYARVTGLDTPLAAQAYNAQVANLGKASGNYKKKKKKHGGKKSHKPSTDKKVVGCASGEPKSKKSKTKKHLRRERKSRVSRFAVLASSVKASKRK